MRFTIPKTIAKKILTTVVRNPSRRVEYLNDYLRFTKWCREHPTPHAFTTRDEMFRFINRDVVRDEPVDYLEFGVYKGESIEFWVSLNQAPESRFYGFDSFEGLPEEWFSLTRTVEKGAFDTRGEVPNIDDPRIRFIKGYFQNVLDGFLADFTPRHRMVIHIDADLYSSTLFILTSMNRFFVPGTILIFDEFYSASHEFKAFCDYSHSFLRKFRLIGTVPPGYGKAVFEVVS
jgi:O-methyltransferase